MRPSSQCFLLQWRRKGPGAVCHLWELQSPPSPPPPCSRFVGSDAPTHPVQEANIRAVNQLLRQAGGVVKIEDVLPLFPDFVQIDAFKDAICQSLEDYNAQV